MKTILLLKRTGTFAENKDAARTIRLEELLPALERGEQVTLDFTGVDGTTQSFVHALLSDVIRTRGPGALDRIYFKGCTPRVQKIIEIVCEYMQAVPRKH